jgi:hypothetical protein
MHAVSFSEINAFDFVPKSLEEFDKSGMHRIYHRCQIADSKLSIAYS